MSAHSLMKRCARACVCVPKAGDKHTFSAPNTMFNANNGSGGGGGGGGGGDGGDGLGDGRSHDQENEEWVDGPMELEHQQVCASISIPVPPI